MTITIFGATGLVGKQLVKQALYKNYIVKAFGRNIYSAGLAPSENLQLIPGALFDEDQVYDAVKGCDCVLSAVGGAFDGTDKSRSLGMKNIIAQMEKAGVKRIIAIGGKGTLNSAAEDVIMNSPGFPKQFIAVSKEHYKAYSFLKESSLSWTFVCPPDILDAPSTGIFHTAANYPPEPDNNKINSGDLALFMINEINKNEYVKNRVGISN